VSSEVEVVDVDRDIVKMSLAGDRTSELETPLEAMRTIERRGKRLYGYRGIGGLGIPTWLLCEL
jgi:hypothetical protein